MYASATVMMGEHFDATGEDVTFKVSTPHGKIGVHTPLLYLSFTRDEALALAAALNHGAALLDVQNENNNNGGAAVEEV